MFIMKAADSDLSKLYVDKYYRANITVKNNLQLVPFLTEKPIFE